jgi:hypothetical protein
VLHTLPSLDRNPFSRLVWYLARSRCCKNDLLQPTHENAANSSAQRLERLQELKCSIFQCSATAAAEFNAAWAPPLLLASLYCSNKGNSQDHTSQGCLQHQRKQCHLNTATGSFAQPAEAPAAFGVPHLLKG